MIEIIKSGGWLMLPIILSSILALAIILERLWVLRVSKIAPRRLLGSIWGWISKGELDADHLRKLKSSCILGRVLSVGLCKSKHGRSLMKEAVEEAASQAIHDMEKYLNTLGTIAAVTPLLGLLGTVIGMIDVFNVIMLKGPGHVSLLAGGISKALITTAAGLTVAIPALVFHRFFVRRVDELVVIMEQECTKLVEILFSSHNDQGSGQR